MRKKINLILLLFVFCNQSLQAQEGFLKVFDSEGIAEYWDVVVDEDTILLYGGAFDSSGAQGIKFVKLDTFGNVLSENIIVDTTRVLTIKTWRKKIIKTSDGGYLVVGSSLFEPYLLKVHHDLSLDFLEFYPSEDSEAGGHTVVETTDGFMLAGSETVGELENQLYVIKTDKQGKQIWRKKPVDKSANVFEIKSYDDNTFILGATYVESHQSASVLICLDSLGNMKWEKVSDYVYDEGWVLDFELMPDSSWVVISSTWEDSPFGGKAMRHMVIRYDNDFNVVWRRIGKTLHPFHQLTDLERTPDGNFIASGWYSILKTNGHMKGVHFKFTPEGDTLWVRLDSIYPDSIVHPEGMHVEGTAILSSGSIISVGWAQKHKVEFPGTYGFVMKITPGGCIEETENCWPVVATTDPLAQTESLLVYPNPASDYIIFSRKGGLWKPKSELIILDVMGRVIRHVFPQGGEVRMETDGFVGGLYFYRFFVDGVGVDFGRFFVE